ncbi:uncharacterized protein LOC121842032 [Oncorhynchus tshawytscha]|uniref:uncharacterized protein LOC121842032 n=1 Tax=Oncorhynchus tshawytscha TaxID=74940 RepID=UPI001C3D6802|nr:uncharacterized protein LOC121842032 [Oncorhynchus tshawytscha]
MSLVCSDRDTVKISPTHVGAMYVSLSVVCSWTTPLIHLTLGRWNQSWLADTAMYGEGDGFSLYKRAQLLLQVPFIGCAPCEHSQDSTLSNTWHCLRLTMAMYITTMCLLLTAASTVECCVLTRATGLTDQRPEPFSIVATMGNTVKLPGYLANSTEPFYKDNNVVYATEHIYDLMLTPVGSQVSIRFLTCTDEGTYRIGSVTFNLSAKADTCAMFYYTAKVDKVKKAALVKPLNGVIRISMLYIEPENSQLWSLIEVWNDTMTRMISPDHCCFMIDAGTTFGGYGDKQYHYFMYQRQGQAASSCSNVHLAASAGASVTTTRINPMLTMTDLKELEDVKTQVKLFNVSDGIRDLKRMIDELEKSWKSAGPSLETHILTPLFIAMTILMMSI